MSLQTIENPLNFPSFPLIYGIMNLSFSSGRVRDGSSYLFIVFFAAMAFYKVYLGHDSGFICAVYRTAVDIHVCDVRLAALLHVYTGSSWICIAPVLRKAAISILIRRGGTIHV